MTTGHSFDERAADWDDERKTARARSVASTIRDTVSPDRSSRLLEYGAGTGLVSQFLAGSVGPITLADPSEGMRAVAREKVDAGVLPAGTRIWDLDLQTSEPPDETFDLIVMVMALHHVPDVSTTLARLAALLSDAGRLCLVDLQEEDGSFHADYTGDEPLHAGFGESTMTAMLADAGLDARYLPGIYHVTKNERAYPLFLAVGTRG